MIHLTHRKKSLKQPLRKNEPKMEDQTSQVFFQDLPQPNKIHPNLTSLHHETGGYLLTNKGKSEHLAAAYVC